jgi:hypothetical protein
MYALLNVMPLLRTALVVLFVGVSVALLAGGLLRRSRYKYVRVWWGTGRLFGLPLAPTLFLAGVLALISYDVATGENTLSIGWMSSTAYVCGGLFWYVGALLCGSTIVTDWGISFKSGRRSMMLPWHEVADYVVTKHKRRNRYVFFTVGPDGHKRRVELFVPVAVSERFQSIVEFRLDSRFDRSVHRSIGREALEQ